MIRHRHVIAISINYFIEGFNMLKRLFISPLSWKIPNSRISEVIGISHNATNLTRCMSLASTEQLPTIQSLSSTHLSPSPGNLSCIPPASLPDTHRPVTPLPVTLTPLTYSHLPRPSVFHRDISGLQSSKLVLNLSPGHSIVTHVRYVHSDKQTSRRKANKADNYSEDVAKNHVSTESSPEKEGKKLSIAQRFKKTYKEHGKILVVVHVVTSVVWYGAFYGAAKWGVDIVPLLETWNFSEKYIKPFRSGGAGDFALAYLFYKLATPARYTVTIVGTQMSIKYLKRGGKMTPVSSEDTLTSLYKESKVHIKRRSAVEVRRGVKNVKSGMTRVKSKWNQRKRTKSKH